MLNSSTGRKLYLDDAEFRIIGAEISYYGIRPTNWVYYLNVAKQCGVNTITCSIPWSMHEIRNGQFDFTKNMDLRRFIESIHAHGFKAILRIGPWISNQLSLGGLPHWLIDSKVKLRVSDTAIGDTQQDLLIEYTIHFQIEILYSEYLRYKLKYIRRIP